MRAVRGGEQRRIVGGHLKAAFASPPDCADAGIDELLNALNRKTVSGQA